jgi:hypothetical protein
MRLLLLLVLLSTFGMSPMDRTIGKRAKINGFMYGVIPGTGSSTYLTM